MVGCNGYIGSRFVEQFHDKYNIAGIDTNFFGNDNEIVSKLKFFLKKDIREIEVNELPKIDYAVHMGELSNDPLGELDPNITKDINHNGTIKLFSLLKMTNVEKNQKNPKGGIHFWPPKSTQRSILKGKSPVFFKFLKK